MYYNVSHILHIFTVTAQLSKALGIGRGDTTQTWQLPSIAVDGPFGTASEVSFGIRIPLCILTLAMYYLYRANFSIRQK